MDRRTCAFSYGDYQKPGLKSNGHLSQTVAFNLSHSADAIQIAIAAEGSLGIDSNIWMREPVVRPWFFRDRREIGPGREGSREHRQDEGARNWLPKRYFLSLPYLVE